MNPRSLQLIYSVALVLAINISGVQGQNIFADLWNYFIALLPAFFRLLLYPFSSFGMFACLFPFVQVNDFGLPPFSMYGEVAACVDTTQAGCDATNSIGFVQNAGRPQDFLYQTTGPSQLQGVVWLTAQDLCSSIISLAKTADSTDRVNTGSLFETDDRGYNYYIRVIGDRTWAFATNDTSSCYSFVQTWDLVYALRIVQGTVNNPIKFVVEPIFADPFLNVARLPLETCEEFTDRPWLRFDMTLVTQETQIEKKVFGNNTGLYETILESFNNGSVVYRRDSWVLGNVVPTPENAGSYYAVQIINGAGEKLQPAYDAWVADVKSKRGSVYFRYLL